MPVTTGALQQNALNLKIKGSSRPNSNASRGNLCVVAVAPSDLSSGVRSLQAAKDIIKPSPSVSVVPGTEIVANSAPKAAPAPSQGMDFVLEQLQSKEKFLSAPKVSVPPTPSVDLPKVDFKMPNVDMSKVMEQVQSKQAELSLPKVPKIDLDVSGTVGGATKDLSEGAAAAASAASQAAAEAASVVSGSVQQASDAVNTVVGGSVQQASELLQRAQTVAVDATSSVVDSVESQISSVVDTLPAPVKDTLGAAASVAGEAAHFIAAEPRVGSAAVAAAIGLPAILAWSAAFGGFAGPLSPEKALDMLKSQDALLVDIRGERQRIDNGVPELKRGARGKGVALPASKLLPSISRRVRNADALAIEILGAQVAALARRGAGTKIIIMDERGEMGKDVARGATAAGIRKVHIVDGGFRAWKNAGLAILEKSSEYDANPLAAVGDAAEIVTEEAAALLGTPSSAALLAAGGALAALALFNYHLLFRFIGVFGVEATIALRVLSYNSPQDAVDDFNNLLATAQNAAQIPMQIVNKVSVALPQESSGSGQAQQQQQQATTEN